MGIENKVTFVLNGKCWILFIEEIYDKMSKSLKSKTLE